MVQPLRCAPGMKLPIIFAALAVTTAAAHADPTSYVQTDVMIGAATPVGGPNLLGAVSGGYLLVPHLWAHAEAVGGVGADDQGGGTHTQIRGGVETRACSTSGIACASAGVDAGVLHGTWVKHDMSEYEHVTAGVIVPRLGLDAGGTHWRGRFGIELAEAFAGSHTSSYAMPSTPLGTVSFELSTGVAYQW
jgi:hypothetical protein